ncbi:MAG TPA: DUF1361 domain-containing protein [Candidatus Saccharimonadales bacterium]|jgi:uncharacterized membrane protein
MRGVRGVVSANGFVWPLVLLTAVSAGFFAVGAFENRSWAFWYLAWNLFLAWLPLLFVFGLLRVIKSKGWTSWPGIALTLLWLGFLPNSFYMVSDFIHLQDYQRVNIVFDAVMFSSFVFTGILLGLTSLYLVHVELAKRLRAASAWAWVAAVLGLSSFAIYLGRDLRMNSWDILTNPAGILFDVSDPIVDPRAHALAFTTMLTFFVFLMSLYIVAWQLIRALKRR